ncbi:MAG: YolD-like family protein [Bacilli bacterium]|nr:YolD-like family protein [Bacilli bacterium]
MPNRMKADRAVQFLPFDGVKGLREALKEAERVVVPKKELGEDEKEALSLVLSELRKGMMVKVVYYENNDYVSYEGIVTRIDDTLKDLTVVKTKIAFPDIIKLEIKG